MKHSSKLPNILSAIRGLALIMFSFMLISSYFFSFDASQSVMRYVLIMFFIVLVFGSFYELFTMRRKDFFMNIYTAAAFYILILLNFLPLDIPQNLMYFILFMIFTFAVYVKCRNLVIKIRANAAKKKDNEEQKIKDEQARIKKMRDEEGIADCGERDIYW